MSASAGRADDPLTMATSIQSLPGAASVEQSDLRRPLQLAVVGFALFVAGAATTMLMAGLFDPVLLVLAALINVVLMLAICLATAVILDVGARRKAGGPFRRTRIVRRTLHLAALYWSAAGLAFLLSPFLARL